MLKSLCFFLALANSCLHIFGERAQYDSSWILIEDQLNPQFIPYHRHQRLPSDKSVDLETLLRNRQNHLRASDGIRFRRSDDKDSGGYDLNRGDLESVVRLREKMMKASDGIRFKRDNNIKNKI